MPLYPYQAEPGQYVADVIAAGRNETITIEMSRQSGKNELSAHVQAWTQARFSHIGGTLIKAAPTWRPQIVRSKSRLEQRARTMRQRLPFLALHSREGYIMECGQMAVNFLSGRPHASAVGDTASIALEIDEAQDFDVDTYNKVFSPMRASTGAPIVAYGTTWTNNTLLEQFKESIAAGRVAGRSFKIDWERVAADNRAYGEFVEGEILRLGVDHPLIMTQYALRPIKERGLLFDAQKLRQMIGDHPAVDRRTTERFIVAGLDYAGADEDAGAGVSLSKLTKRDSVALTVAEAEWVVVADGLVLPLVRVKARYEWVNIPPSDMHTTLYDILHAKWRVDRLHVDGTGIGEVPAQLLSKALSNYGIEGRTQIIKFNAAWSHHTRLAYQMIAATNGSRFKDYRPMRDYVGFDPLPIAAQKSPPTSDPTMHVWWQRAHARMETRPGKKARLYVPDSEGHDDLIISDALMLDAAYAADGNRDSGITI